VRALVLTHAAHEGPGLLASWLPEEGLDLDVVALWRGEPVPASLDGYRALVVLGGPQQAYDDASALWLADVKALLRHAVAQHVPTLAVCLGAQLLAHALGGTVAPGEQGPELGARLVGKRDAAGADPLFWDLPLSPLVVQWHWDAVTALPPAATLLMAGTAYENQAFRVGDRAWGLQFHVESDEAVVRAWAECDRADLEEHGVDVDAIVDRALASLDEVAEVWGEVARRFARLALES
jgi:GMP synthase-like glutamine amidotransferase